MVRRINEAFSDSDHEAIKSQKENLRKKYNLRKLSWEKYLLHISGVRKIGTDNIE